MFKFMKIGFISVAFAFCMTNLHAQEKREMNAEEIKQANYLKGAMQKEIWSIILTDTFELQQEELKTAKIFKEDDKFKISKYQEWMTEICVEEKTSSCPEVFFTRKDNIQVASMYPNAKMYLNIDVLNRLTDDEVYFAVAHEMGHFVLQHSFKRTQAMAESIVENGFMVAEMEKMVAASFMIPGMRDFHHEVEAQADMFAVKYIKKKKIKIDCEKMFEKMINGGVVSTEKHAGTAQRCKAIGY